MFLNTVALKMGPLVIPIEAVLTNITGPENIVRQLEQNLPIDTVVGI